LIKSYTSAIEKYGKQSQQFYTDHQKFIQGLYLENRTTARNEKFRKMLGIQPGFATDIMTSQDFCRPFSSEMTPVSDEKIKAFQQKISTPFIADYAQLKNDETKAKIAGNKKLTGSKANEVPKAAGDKVFDAIMDKYKGKVVYVDFWATWCAPCRSGIEQIKPLKDEMAGENVAFVYISGPSSPKATYDNMIPTIKGEHYRVSADEWNILCGMFKISGIPHYLLVGKDGKVINPHLAHMENMQLKALLMKYIKE
jgi:thiol-disulfide isomerase/thioredoxin